MQYSLHWVAYLCHRVNWRNISQQFVNAHTSFITLQKQISFVFFPLGIAKELLQIIGISSTIDHIAIIEMLFFLCIEYFRCILDMCESSGQQLPCAILVCIASNRRRTAEQCTRSISIRWCCKRHDILCIIGG